MAQPGASFLAWDDSVTHLYAVDESNSRVESSGGVHVFDLASGRPVDTGIEIAVDQPSFVGIAALP